MIYLSIVIKIIKNKRRKRLSIIILRDNRTSHRNRIENGRIQW